MSKSINSATIGELVRQTRLTAGLTQTELGKRIGASRFWVAEFEKGKPSAELGLALRAIQALGLTVRIGAPIAAQLDAKTTEPRGTKRAASRQSGATLDAIIAHAILTTAAPSKVVGWPVSGPATPSRKR